MSRRGRGKAAMCKNNLYELILTAKTILDKNCSLQCADAKNGAPDKKIMKAITKRYFAITVKSTPTPITKLLPYCNRIKRCGNESRIESPNSAPPHMCEPRQGSGQKHFQIGGLSHSDEGLA